MELIVRAVDVGFGNGLHHPRRLHRHRLQINRGDLHACLDLGLADRGFQRKSRWRREQEREYGRRQQAVKVAHAAAGWHGLDDLLLGGCPLLGALAPRLPRMGLHVNKNDLHLCLTLDKIHRSDERRLETAFPCHGYPHFCRIQQSDRRDAE